MQDTFRLWFVFAYALGFLFFLTQILRFRAGDQVVERGSVDPPTALGGLTTLGSVPKGTA